MNLIKPKELLLTTASAAAVALTPNVATAQVTPTDDTRTGFTIDEIVVTARRKSENVQSTPIAITAVSGETLEQRGFQAVSYTHLTLPTILLV